MSLRVFCSSVCNNAKPLLCLSRYSLHSQPSFLLHCQPYRLAISSYSTANGNSNGGQKFRSLLKDSSVQSPFDDPSRPSSFQRRPLLTSTIAQLSEKKDSQSGTPRAPQQEDLKKKTDELLLSKQSKQSPEAASDKPSVANVETRSTETRQQAKKMEEEDEEMGQSALGGSTTVTISAYRRFWKRFHKIMRTEVDENATYEERRRQKMARNTKLGSLILLTGSCVGFVWFCFYYGRAKRDEQGRRIEDEFSGSFFGPFYRIMNSFKLWKDYVVEPSREVLLPDPLPPPYLQPKYTLVIEMKNILIAPEWTYKTGHRFVKRPALDYFLDIVGYPNFEVVIYTAESSMTAPQVIESFDPKQRIMYKLYRDCTKYMNGHHVKDLSRLNRDLSKVIFIDHDPKSFQLNPENVLRLPKWDGDMDDTSLVDLAELLKTIHLSDVEDVRPTLQYYSQFDDPPKEFRRRAMYLAQQEHAMKEQQEQHDQSLLKRYSGRLFGYRRHA